MSVLKSKQNIKRNNKQKKFNYNFLQFAKPYWIRDKNNNWKLVK